MPSVARLLGTAAGSDGGILVLRSSAWSIHALLVQMNLPALVPAMRQCLDRLLDQDCVLCDSPCGSATLCPRCEALLAQDHVACPCCGMPSPDRQVCGSCLTGPPAFDATLFALRYAFPADGLIRQLKFSARLPLARLLGRILLERIRPHLHGVDMIVPVPMHPRRLAWRGFNQAVELLRPLVGEGSHPPVLPDAVQRTRPTLPQADLPADRRRSNVRGSFVCRTDMRGRRVALVDDVMTTGATLDELARVLKRCGAVHVENWVVARTWRD